MKRLIGILTVLTFALFTSCDQDEVNDALSSVLTEKEEAIVTNDAAADNVTEALDYEIDFFTGSNQCINELDYKGRPINGRWPRYLLEEGPEITVEPPGDAFPKTVTIDYGDGIELINGRAISGIVFVEISAPPATNGATRTISFQDFFIDSVNIEGSGTRTFTGEEGTERVFSCVNSFTLTFPDETFLEREGQRTRTLVEGFETVFDHSDDLITVIGSVNYSNSDGETFSKTIQNKLIKTGNCRFIAEGTVLFTYNGEDFASLDYGDGTCDDIATITKDGETIQITIGQRRRFSRQH